MAKTKTDIKFALVGCGSIAKRHAELPGNRRIADASLAAVCDIVPEKACAMGEKFGVPYYTDMHSTMREAPVDAVSVLTESGHHAAHVIALAGLREAYSCGKAYGADPGRRGCDDKSL